jgi:dTDP-4-dehydrorhamnose 3,5-epimerase
MIITPLAISGAWLIEAPVFPDKRGQFREWYRSEFSEISALPQFDVKQANTSVSARGVIRGIHYSCAEGGQSKIVTCTSGAIQDVVVDLRVNSDTYGKHESIEISWKDGISIFISNGLGHGFQSLHDDSVVTYLLNSNYQPEKEFSIKPTDATLAIQWRIKDSIISDKDTTAPSLSELFARGDLPNA